jgi:hypothetical protein
MADRYRTASGWSVEVVERSATPDHSDGQQLRVRYHGFYVADVRTIAELEQYFPLADLEPDGLIAVPRRPAGIRRARHQRDHHRGRGGGPMTAVSAARVPTAIRCGWPGSLSAVLPASSAGNCLPVRAGLS